MKNVAAETYRNINFSRAKRGPVVKPEPDKTKISIRLDNAVLEYFRNLVDKARPARRGVARDGAWYHLKASRLE
jgi:hypothetical protein